MPPALVTVAGDFLVHGALRLRLDAFLRHCLTPVAGCPEPSAPQAPHAVLRALAAAAAEILAAHASELQGLAERAAAARASFEGGDFPTGSCDGAPTVAPPVTLLEAMHLTRGVRDDIGLLARLCLGMEGADEEAVLSAVLQAGREVHGRGQVQGWAESSIGGAEVESTCCARSVQKSGMGGVLHAPYDSKSTMLALLAPIGGPHVPAGSRACPLARVHRPGESHHRELAADPVAPERVGRHAQRWPGELRERPAGRRLGASGNGRMHAPASHPGVPRQRTRGGGVLGGRRTAAAAGRDAR